MTKTTNYQLNQWAKSDRIMMDDFNSDNAKIDAALKANADAIAAVGYVTGTYTGTGSYPRTISLGFQPKAVVLTTYTGYTNNSGSPFGGVFGVGMPLSGCAEVASNGFVLKAEYVNQKKHRLQLHRIQVIGCGHKKGKASKGAFPFCPAAITSICIRCTVPCPSEHCWSLSSSGRSHCSGFSSTKSPNGRCRCFCCSSRGHSLQTWCGLPF